MAPALTAPAPVDRNVPNCPVAPGSETRVGQCAGSVPLLALAAGAALIVAACVVFGLVALHESPEKAGARTFSCVLGRDAGCLLRYTSNDEKTRLGLTRENLQALLDGFVGSRLAGFRPSGPATYDKFYGGEVTTIHQLLKSPDGRKTEFVVSLGNGGDGLYCSNLVTAIVSMAVAATLPSNGTVPHGRDKARFVSAAVQSGLGELESSGVPGMLVGGPPDEKFYTWREYIQGTSEVASRP